MKVSYCSTCKGRLNQLKKTLLPNLEALRLLDAEWIIVDYFCPDNTAEELMKVREVRQLMSDGKLRLFKFEKDIPFFMPFAKNLSHSKARGDYLFNLDIDNFIGNSYSQIISLKPNKSFMVAPSLVNRVSDGSGGRIAVPRSIFHQMGGYDLDLDSMGYDDINFQERLLANSFLQKVERDIIPPIKNTKEDSTKYIENVRPLSQVFFESMKISNKKLKNKDLIINKNGLLFHKEEDMSKYLEQVYSNGAQGNVVTRL